MGSFPFGDFAVFRGFDDGLGFGGGGGRSMMPSTSLVLDEERRELVTAPAMMARKGFGGGGVVSEVRAAMASKNHSEAERRRRQRINSHLSSLRSLVSTTSKMDKAALLAEVIKELKELKRNAIEFGKRCSIPSDTDEARVETIGSEMDERGVLLKASVCCEDRPELLAALKRVLDSLKLRIVSAEISTLGGRVKGVFVMTCEGSSVQQELEDALDRIASQGDFSPGVAFSGKRRRISPFESSSSSS